MQKGMHNRGFTLIELLVTVAIIALLSSSVLASVQSSREKARMAAALNFDDMVARTLGDRLVAEWNFESPTNPWGDVSAQGHNGSCTTCPTRTVGYNGGSGAAFTGVEQLNVGVGSDYLPMKAFTICAWAKSPGMAAGMTQNGIISLSYGVVMGINNLGHLYSETDSTGTTTTFTLQTNNLYDNKFHLLCLSEDDTKRLLYIDGALLANQPNPGWTGTTPWNALNAVIGTDYNNWPVYMFNGTLDDIRIYSGSITQN